MILHIRPKALKGIFTILHCNTLCSNYSLSITMKLSAKFYKQLEYFIMFVIVLSSIAIGLETDTDLETKFGFAFRVLDVVILGIFSIEAILKILAEGNKPLRYFSSAWNLFDLFILIICVVPYFISNQDTHIFATLRILRLARALRVFRVFRLITQLRPLQILVESLIKSIPSLLYVVLLMTIIFYVYSIVGVFLFKDNDIEHFGSLGVTMLTLFKTITGGISWSDLMDKLIITEGGIALFYFVSFLIVAGLVMLNLFVGIIVSEMSIAKEFYNSEIMKKSDT